MRHTKPLSLITVFTTAILMLFWVSNTTSCTCKNRVSQDNQPQDLPPVRITEAYKLELLRGQYMNLRNSAGPGAASRIVFQFAYKNGDTRKLTLIAYASRPGRRYWDKNNPAAHPLVVEYLNPILTDPIPPPFALPTNFSLGDQEVEIGNHQSGIEQLISSSPNPANYYSLTFTPTLSNQNYSGGTITNIKYHICVKYPDPLHPGQFLEFCPAGPLDTQPSPPANAN